MYISTILVSLTSTALSAAVGNVAGAFGTQLADGVHVEIYSGFDYTGEVQMFDVPYDGCFPVDGSRGVRSVKLRGKALCRLLNTERCDDPNQGQFRFTSNIPNVEELGDGWVRTLICRHERISGEQQSEAKTEAGAEPDPSPRMMHLELYSGVNYTGDFQVIDGAMDFSCHKVDKNKDIRSIKVDVKSYPGSLPGIVLLENTVCDRSFKGLKISQSDPDLGDYSNRVGIIKAFYEPA